MYLQSHKEVCSRVMPHFHQIQGCPVSSVSHMAVTHVGAMSAFLHLSHNLLVFLSCGKATGFCLQFYLLVTRAAVALLTRQEGASSFAAEAAESLHSQLGRSTQVVVVSATAQGEILMVASGSPPSSTLGSPPDTTPPAAPALTNIQL